MLGPDKNPYTITAENRKCEVYICMYSVAQLAFQLSAGHQHQRGDGEGPAQFGWL